MIAQINISKIMNNFKFNPDKRASGMIYGIKWQLIMKKQVSNELYRYVFMYTINSVKGGSLSTTGTLITEDMDIREAAEIILRDHDSTN